jgi:hypothetical protein
MHLVYCGPTPMAATSSFGMTMLDFTTSFPTGSEEHGGQHPNFLAYIDSWEQDEAL